MHSNLFHFPVQFNTNIAIMIATIVVDITVINVTIVILLFNVMTIVINVITVVNVLIISAIDVVNVIIIAITVNVIIIINVFNVILKIYVCTSSTESRCRRRRTKPPSVHSTRLIRGPLNTAPQNPFRTPLNWREHRRLLWYLDDRGNR